jgi:hypothetical protein
LQRLPIGAFKVTRPSASVTPLSRITLRPSAALASQALSSTT